MITRYDPFREAVSLRRMMDQLFEQSFVNPSLMAGTASMMVPMDVCETPKGYEVDVALPGVRPEDIELIVDQNALTIRGQFSQQNEHQNQPQGQGQQQQAQQGQPQSPAPGPAADSAVEEASPSGGTQLALAGNRRRLV